MPKRTLREIREDGHWPQYGSIPTSVYDPISRRPLSSATVECECGWMFNDGEAGFRRPDAERKHKSHLREVEAMD